MLDVNNVHFSYNETKGRNFTFNLKTKDEEILVVEGVSGIGKSTLLHLIAGLLEPHSGDIRWKGQNLCGMRPDKRPLSMIFQTGNSAGNLFEHLTCRQNVAIGLSPRIKLNKTEWQVVDTALEVLGIGSLAHQCPDLTSGGQQQRVALARALVRAECQGRDLLLLDEPFSALDPATRQDCINAVLSLMAKRPMTVVIVSHDRNDAKALGARQVSIKSYEYNALGQLSA